MAQNDRIIVRILDFPVSSGGCACGTGGYFPEMAVIFQQKVAELREALEEAYPGRTKVEYVNLKESQEERESEIGQLLVTRKYPSPLVVISGEPKFAGSILVKKIVKEVGNLLH
jgi:disulfide oxidoreductase YuzD|uniref:Uncharacterized protein n=1 Tax=Desulfobacca acetoxidans TaxID=60893 RepID=A0A7C3WGQ6_9BACT